MRAEPYRPEHAATVMIRENIDLPAEEVAMLALGTHHLMEGGTTLSDDSGKVLLCAGVSPLTPAVGEAWILINRHGFGRYTHGIHKTLTRIVRDAASRYRRIQASCRADDPRGLALMARLGFTKEALMKDFDLDGTDHILARFDSKRRTT